MFGYDGGRLSFFCVWYAGNQLLSISLTVLKAMLPHSLCELTKSWRNKKTHTHPHRGVFVGLILWSAQGPETKCMCLRVYTSANHNWNKMRASSQSFGSLFFLIGDKHTKVTHKNTQLGRMVNSVRNSRPLSIEFKCQAWTQASIPEEPQQRKLLHTYTQSYSSINTPSRIPEHYTQQPPRTRTC